MIELTKDFIVIVKSIIAENVDALGEPLLHDLYPADIAELYQ